MFAAAALKMNDPAKVPLALMLLKNLNRYLGSCWAAVVTQRKSDVTSGAFACSYACPWGWRCA
eukprot:15045193-Alexandrium_andersonii.AAC.1